jgi:molybdopterin synthase sulfur carrier subunit
MESHVQLKLFASLSKFSPRNPDRFSISPGETVGAMLKRLGVPLDDVRLIFLDGVKGEITSALQGGERVGVFPPVGGG